MPNKGLFCALQGREIKRRKQHRSELFYLVFIAAKIDIPNTESPAAGFFGRNVQKVGNATATITVNINSSVV